MLAHTADVDELTNDLRTFRLQTCKTQIPDIFQINEVLMVSDPIPVWCLTVAPR